MTFLKTKRAEVVYDLLQFPYGHETSISIQHFAPREEVVQPANRIIEEFDNSNSKYASVNIDSELSEKSYKSEQKAFKGREGENTFKRKKKKNL
ncbi:hypothetical protein CEXT_141531 [Caerostris extrusa]|uniref:Uncharacterized protein n=1 Tax=Caerostris extrusa TaxID=172846 RepID=A0AAV4XYK3_CAEEX|nr:hypothetical protein CEXT_141531 [Caerostris extrusa]